MCSQLQSFPRFEDTIIIEKKTCNKKNQINSVKILMFVFCILIIIDTNLKSILILKKQTNYQCRTSSVTLKVLIVIFVYLYLSLMKKQILHSFKAFQYNFRMKLPNHFYNRHSITDSFGSFSTNQGKVRQNSY